MKFKVIYADDSDKWVVVSDIKVKNRRKYLEEIIENGFTDNHENKNYYVGPKSIISISEID